jgi:hypothetical protein
MKRRNLFDAFFTIVVLSLVGGTLYTTQGCAGAPKSKQQFEQMSEEDFQNWLTRVALWSELAATQVVRDHPDQAEKIKFYAAALDGLGAHPDPLVYAAKKAGLDSTLATVLVLEAKALLNARGGMPEGDRFIELLRTVAAGVRAGVEHAANPTTTGKL